MRREVKMYKRILIPLVPLGKKWAIEAYVQHAVTLTPGIDAEVILLQVMTVLPDREYYFQRVPSEKESSRARQKAEAEDYVSRMAKQLQEKAVSITPVVFVSEKTESEAIVEYATQSDCHLIVLPNHQRSLISRWLHGNIVANVQRHSHIPILLVGKKIS